MTSARQITCPCFAGPGLDRMIVTSAWERLDPRGPEDGQTFPLAPGVRGRPEPRVRLARDPFRRPARAWDTTRTFIRSFRRLQVSATSET